MLDNAVKWLVYLAVVAGVIFVGWSQPLRYRFMSTQEIYLLEHPAAEVKVVRAVATPTPTPAPAATPWMWDPNRRTKLDR